MNILSIVMSIIVLLIVPVLIGSKVYGILKMEPALTESFVFGHITMWAVCQLIAVPLILLKADFRVVLYLLSIIYIIVILYGIWKKYYIKRLFNSINSRKELVAVCVLIIVCLSILILETLLQHTDADDSRFVVNAVDIIRTNKMFLTDPGTGEPLEIWKGELTRDVISPWAVYIAYCAKVTGIHPTIMAHTVFPMMLLTCVCCVYWLISQLLYSDMVYRCIMVIFVLLLNVYGYCSVYTAETFMLTRIWQGKAVVAALGIPCYILIFLWIYNNEKDRKSNYVLLVILQTAMCLTSGMGILIGAFMTGCFGLVYGLLQKNVKMMTAMWLTIIPNIICYGITFMV